MGKTITKVMVALVAVVMVAACSDGAAMKEPGLQPSASCNTTLTAYKVGGSVDDAVSGEININTGEGVVLLWNATPVTSATLTSEPSEVVGQPIELQVSENPETKIKGSSGSMEFRALAQAASFTVVGSNAEEGKKAVECKSTISVIVSDAPVALAINKFDAVSSSVAAGATTKVCWDVNVEGAALSMTDDTGAKIELPTTTTDVPVAAKAEAVEVSDEAVEEGSTSDVPAVTTTPSEGCVDVKPTKDTVYTLTATTSDGQSATETTQVSISKEQLVVNSFTADGLGDLRIAAAKDVTLAWDVSPSTAKVSIEGVGDDLGAVGTKSATVSATTAFKLTATLNDQNVTKQVTVTIDAGTATDVKATLRAGSNDVFVGEPVRLTWTIDSASGVPAGAKIVLNSSSASSEVTGTSIDVLPQSNEIYSIDVVTSAGTVRSNSVSVNVRQWSAADANGSWSSVEVLKDGKQTVFGGASNSPASLATAIYSMAGIWKDVSIAFDVAFEAAYTSSYQRSLLKTFGDFPINAIALDKVGGSRLFLGTTGGIMHSDDSGQSWKMTEISLLFKESREHATCHGGVQKHDAKLAGIDNLVRYCDLIVVTSPAGTARLLAASDHGAYYADDIDDLLAGNKKKQHWFGVYKSKSTNELTGTVVDALEEVGGKVFAGTAKGVWVSDNMGANWADFNGGDISSGTAIYELAANVADKLIYAAGPEGIFVSQLGSASWKKVAGSDSVGTVYALAIDESTVLAGSDKGMFASRDGGATWNDISSTLAGATVYDIAVAKVGMNVAIYAATSGGAFASVTSRTIPKIDIRPVVTEPTTPVIPEVTPVNPVDPETDVPTVTETMKSMI